MASARPGHPDANHYPRNDARNDYTRPDLYGEAGGRGGARLLAPPRPPEPPEEPWPAEPPGRPAGRRRRQWGGDRRSQALAMVPEPVSDTRVAMGRLAIIITVCAWLGYTVMWCFSDFFHPGYEGAVARTEEVLYLVIVTLLTVSALAYLLARLGFMYRTRTHHRATRASLDQYYDARQPTLTTIIPSYQEEERVIRTTLLSAALQEYPDKRVVLLIDDPLRAEERQGQGAAGVRPGPAGQDRAAAGRARAPLLQRATVVRAGLAARRPAGAGHDDGASQRLQRRGQLDGEPGRPAGDHRPHRRVLRQRDPAAPGGVVP